VTQHGQWIERERPWHETNVMHCYVCAPLVPRPWWQLDGAAGEVNTCGPFREELCETYWKPKYGVVRQSHPPS
jgi:hypothetical protein